MVKSTVISKSVTIRASPDEVYDALMNSKKHAAFTGDAARISPKVGGKIVAGGEYIFGKNIELVKGKKIVQEWKTSEWPEGCPPSILKITLTKTRGGTRLAMYQSRVPEGQREYYAEGWDSYYWKPLKSYLEGRNRAA